ncbi:uncharacterized protein PV07_07120 [Cladophialophora immunda]|uniref:Heterokaryon incompatibility domain-containing protein n=1 Tax=Cladophialophora immunda TaxID=569365 RepID=A0A0D2AQK4_9EURO|nr:uncharacterized protein PV07_07120 [Cladophialophora immunda]KIW27377.1 hypothetical protein PV07_07120 [Cladophialophora immunda]
MPCFHDEAHSYVRFPGRAHQFIESSQTCSVCKLLVEVVEQVKPGWLQRDPDKSVCLEYDSNQEKSQRGSSTLIVSLQERRSGGVTGNLAWGILKLPWQTVESFRYFIYSEGGPAVQFEQWPVLHKTGTVVDDTLSAAAADLAAKWLSDCCSGEGHPRCKIPDPEFTPRRLVNVGLSDPNAKPRLEAPKTPRDYACLSYCWGPDVEEIKEKLQASVSQDNTIDVSLLPQTMKDAILFCRRLQIPNLWIDGLCIDQQDAEAKKHGIAEMHKVFANAKLVLAAAEPASCKQGFLGRQNYGNRPLQWLFETAVPVEAGGSPGDKILIRRLTSDRKLDARSSLDRRGWCLQESNLSMRSLYFNGDEMTWECNHRVICECGHKSRSKEDGELKGLHRRPWEERVTTRREYVDWMDLVGEYSDRSLYQGDDRLPAISGLAEEIARRLGVVKAQSYFSGLWKENFILGLAWHVDRSASASRPRFERPATVHFPSWSWASITKSVAYSVFDNPLGSSLQREELVEDCRVREIHHCDDPTEVAYPGAATLSGSLVSVEHKRLSKSATRQWKRDSGYAMNLGDPEELDIVSSQNGVGIQVLLDERNEADQCICDHCSRKLQEIVDDQSKGESPQLFCLRLFTWRIPEARENPRSHHVWYLLLQKVPQKYSKERDVFRRIGMGILDGYRSSMFEHSKESEVIII